MSDVNTNRLDAMMRKISGLLAKADDPASSEQEAESCRMMAERIMRKYKIEEEDLIKKGDLKVDVLNVLFREVPICPFNSEYQDGYKILFSIIAEHCDLEAVLKGWATHDGVTQIMGEYIGYEADIRYAEMLFNNARFFFGDRMEPKYNPNLSDEDNVYRMRSAGMERRRIAEVMGWVKGGAKVTRLYKRACEARGEEPVLTGQGTDVKVYREQYAQQFRWTLRERLQRAKDMAIADVGGGLVLHGRADRIKEAMYERYPSLRPTKTPATTTTTPKVRARKWTKADERRWLRSQSAAAQAGAQAGKAAAQQVEIKTTNNRLEG